MWKLGRIVEMRKGKGVIRRATVQLANGTRWIRPVSLLLPMEITGDETESTEEFGVDDCEQEEMIKEATKNIVDPNMEREESESDDLP
ncbi:unnamed protein product [Gongylonema pulchrum]|uniref:DUF5641 domain-containing protein n=1 Tax=Gongylonema pulchrum TaxID=637853 RepID=A0A183EUS4_9BILA|nr:unnamed protein product [Gongylonema pulchrum]